MKRNHHPAILSRSTLSASLLCAMLTAVLTCITPWPAHAAPAKHAAEEESPAMMAQNAAKAWMMVVDSDQYGKSWDQSATLFQSDTARDKWEINMIRIRGLLGAAEKRKLVSASAKRSLPGLPDGEYVVITWATQFEHKARALEIITAMKDKDGKWKVAGYVIK